MSENGGKGMGSYPIIIIKREKLELWLMRN